MKQSVWKILHDLIINFKRWLWLIISFTFLGNYECSGLKLKKKLKIETLLLICEKLRFTYKTEFCYTFMHISRVGRSYQNYHHTVSSDPKEMLIAKLGEGGRNYSSHTMSWCEYFNLCPDGTVALKCCNESGLL